MNTGPKTRLFSGQTYHRRGSTWQRELPSGETIELSRVTLNGPRGGTYWAWKARLLSWGVGPDRVAASGLALTGAKAIQALRRNLIAKVNII